MISITPDEEIKAQLLGLQNTSETLSRDAETPSATPPQLGEQTNTITEAPPASAPEVALAWRVPASENAADSSGVSMDTAPITPTAPEDMPAESVVGSSMSSLSELHGENASHVSTVDEALQSVNPEAQVEPPTPAVEQGDSTQAAVNVEPRNETEVTDTTTSTQENSPDNVVQLDDFRRKFQSRIATREQKIQAINEKWDGKIADIRAEKQKNVDILNEKEKTDISAAEEQRHAEIGPHEEAVNALKLAEGILEEEDSTEPEQPQQLKQPEQPAQPEQIAS
jgi:hypothetical protein